MSEKQLVLAFFDSEDEADSAVSELKQWDKSTKEVDFASIGILVKNEKGKIKTHKLGGRRSGTGAIIFGLAAVLTGGALLVGAAFGAVVGAFFHKGLGLSKEDQARIGGELDSGKAAVCVVVPSQEAAAVAAKLAELGGRPEAHDVSEEAVQQAEQVVAEMPEEAPDEEAPAEPAADEPVA